GDEQVGTLRFGGQLVFHEKLSGQVQDTRPAEPKADHIVLTALLAATQPGQSRRAALRQERCFPIPELGFKFFPDEVFCGRERNRLDVPTHVAGPNGFAFRILPGAAHAVGEALGERETVLGRTVVVLAGTDVATGAIEMDVQRGGDRQLPEETRQPGKVRMGNTCAVVALWM